MIAIGIAGLVLLTANILGIWAIYSKLDDDIRERLTDIRQNLDEWLEEWRARGEDT